MAEPIAIAPRGYRAAKGSTLGRLTCSFAATEEAADLLTATAEMGVRLGCPLRIVTFGVRGCTMYITGSTWPGTVLAAGAVISIFSVTLVVIYGQTRILFAMARDGMIPELFHKVNPVTRTPVPNTIIVATIIALLAGFIPINFLAEMTSVGTLVAFTVVSIAVMVLRYRQPDLPRTFKVPGFPVTPILAILGCLWIIKDLRPVTLLVFIVWTAIVLAWYFTYGLKHSHLGRHEHVGLAIDLANPDEDPGKGPSSHA